MKGVDRLKKLAEGQEKPSLLKVIEYLVNVDELDEMYLNVDKSLKSMADYINDMAKKLSKDGYCWVEDTTVYEWAINYWSKSDEELGIKRVIPTPKTKAEVTRDEVIPEVKQVGQLSLF